MEVVHGAQTNVTSRTAATTLEPIRVRKPDCVWQTVVQPRSWAGLIAMEQCEPDFRDPSGVKTCGDSAAAPRVGKMEWLWRMTAGYRNRNQITLLIRDAVASIALLRKQLLQSDGIFSCCLGPY